MKFTIIKFYPIVKIRSQPYMLYLFRYHVYFIDYSFIVIYLLRTYPIVGFAGFYNLILLL